MHVLGDFQTSVRKSLSEIDPAWESYEGLIVCGSHSPKNIEETIEAIKEARETKTTFLGICWGHQAAAIEYARNVLGIKDATSEEIGKGTFVVKKLPELNVGLKNGESNWNNYEVDFEIMKDWEKAGNFISVQYHPEYESSQWRPHPILKKFLTLCK